MKIIKIKYTRWCQVNKRYTIIKTETREAATHKNSLCGKRAAQMASEGNQAARKLDS